MSSQKKVLVNSTLYTMGNILLKVFSFLLIPLYTAYLAPNQYGIMNLAFGFSSVVSCLIMCGLQYAVVRFYTEYKRKRILVASMFGTVISFVLLCGLIASVLLLLTSPFWKNLIFTNIPFFPIILIAIILSAVTALYTIYQDILKGMQKAKKSVSLSYIYFFLLLGGNILTVVTFKMGASGILLSTLIVNVVMILVMLWDLKQQQLLILGIRLKLIKILLKYSLPLLPHSLAYSVSSFFTRIIINMKMSTSMLGLYTLASQFGGVADVVSNSVQSAFQPWFYEKLSKAEYGNKESIDEIRRLTNLLLLLYGGIYLVIGAWCKEVIDMMAARAYHPAWTYVPFLIMAVSIKSPLYFYQNFFYYDRGKTYNIFICTLIGSISSMCFVYILIPYLGVYGAIIGDSCALIIRLIVTIGLGKHLINSVYSISKLSVVTLLTIVWLGITVLPIYMNFFTSELINIVYKSLCIILYIGFALYKSNININYLKKIIHK